MTADVFMDTGVGILGTNMFIYANNDPINFIDPTGYSALRLLWDTMTAPIRGAGEILQELTSDVDWGFIGQTAGSYAGGPDAIRARQRATHDLNNVLTFELDADETQALVDSLDGRFTGRDGLVWALGIAALGALVGGGIGGVIGLVGGILTPYGAYRFARHLEDVDAGNGVVIRIDLNNTAPLHDGWITVRPRT